MSFGKLIALVNTNLLTLDFSGSARIRLSYGYYNIQKKSPYISAFARLSSFSLCIMNWQDKPSLLAKEYHESPLNSQVTADFVITSFLEN